jgi:hypothetical protein
MTTMTSGGAAPQPAPAFNIVASRSRRTLALSSLSPRPQPSMNVNEQDPLLARNYAHDDSLEAHAAAERRERTSRARAAVHVLLALAFVVAIPVMFFVIQPRLAKDGLPKDPVAAVELLLRGAPVIVSAASDRFVQRLMTPIGRAHRPARARPHELREQRLCRRPQWPHAGRR